VVAREFLPADDVEVHLGQGDGASIGLGKAPTLFGSAGASPFSLPASKSLPGPVWGEPLEMLLPLVEYFFLLFCINKWYYYQVPLHNAPCPHKLVEAATMFSFFFFVASSASKSTCDSRVCQSQPLQKKGKCT
jgi:hypothetical protein